MGETRGLNFVPEPESDGSDIRGYPNPRVKLPSLHGAWSFVLVRDKKGGKWGRGGSG
jgi:hypothetical protein